MKTDQERPVLHALPARLAAFLGRFRLRSILIGGFTILMIASIVVVVIAKWGEEHSLSLMNRFIRVDNVISDLCLKSTTAMTSARRNEKDFILNYKEFGFDEARSRYITRVLTDLEDIKGFMQSIRGMSRDPEMTRLTGEVDRAVERYKTGLLAFVDAYGRRGYYESGIEGGLIAEARAMEDLLKSSGDDLLRADLLAVRRAEKNFIERSRDRDVSLAREGLDRLRSHVAAAALNEDLKKRVLVRAAAYGVLFGQYVVATEDIRNIKRDYLKAVQAVDPLLEKLYVLSLDRLRTSRNTMEGNIRRADYIVLATGLAMILLSAVVALVVSDLISRSVIESKAFAEKIAAGDLASRLTPVGDNELSALSTALNAMAESLHQSASVRNRIEGELRQHHEYLEELVAKRTAEAMKATQLASIGELAAGVAHEINNPINGIINFAQILTDRSGDDPVRKEIAERIIREGDRIAGIVSSLLAFGRERKFEKTSVRLGDALAEILPLSSAQLHKDGIQLVIEGMDEVPEITASPQQLQQVFLNLISNARYALNQKFHRADEGKRLEIRAQAVVLNGVEYARIVFRDTGAGISPADMARLTTPFFTTKPQGQGTGLGLSISRAIIEDHGGVLSLQSDEGHYTEVVIDLPVRRLAIKVPE